MPARPNALVSVGGHPPGSLIVEQLCRRCRRRAVRLSATHLCPRCRDAVAHAA